MKTKIISFLMLVNSIFLYAQLETTQPVQISEEQKIQELLQNLTLACKYNIKPLIEQLVVITESIEKGADMQKTTNGFNFQIREFSDLDFKISGRSFVNDELTMIKVNALVINEDNYKSFDFFLYIVKQHNDWFIRQDGLSRNLLEWAGNLVLKNIESNGFREDFTPRYSNSTLIQTKFNSAPTIWEINKDLTNNHINRDLFGTGAELDMELYWYGSQWPNDVATFALDATWNRIIYGQKSSNTLKSYGDNQGDYKFNHPLGFTIDDEGYIYVADTYNKKIVKLFYNYNNNLITLINVFNIPNLKGPRDIFYSRGYANSDNKLWILDGSTALGINDVELIVLDKYGSILNRFSQYELWGNTYDFYNPIRIVSSKESSIPILLDDSKKILI